jgi:phosphatidylinositol alpha-1,6-mannosyltransferase
MKRLMIISTEFPPGPGGIGTHAYQVAKHLAGAGWQVRVLSPQDYADADEIAQFNRQQGFEVCRLPTLEWKAWQALQRLMLVQRSLRDFRPDLVIASGRFAIWYAGLLVSFRMIPWLMVGHGTEFGANQGWWTWLTRVSGNWATGAICVSEYTQKALRALGVRKPPSVVIYNGADHRQYDALPEDAVKAFRIGEAVEKDFVLLTVGSVTDRKGQEVVIKALPKIKAEHPHVMYWMAGLPQKQAALEQLARELGVLENIRFWGRVSQETLLQLYNACDLFVMTSRQLADGDFEGYGIAVIEAALCGKAAVVSDNSGLAEAVLDGQTGLLVPQNDPDATADAVLALAGDKARLRQMSRTAQKIALENQTWEKVGERYEKALESVIETGSLCAY